MKTIIIIAVSLLAISTTQSQNINWKNFQHAGNVVNVNTGLDYGLNWGVGYGYHVKFKLPVFVNTEFSAPFGNEVFDDYKIKVGGQIQPIGLGNFLFTARVYGIIRHYQSDLVRMMNYGSELSAVVGYYKPKWYLAGEFGFDKAITTHIRNSSAMRSQFPEVRNGWFIPTGGNYLYGLQAGYSLSRFDVTLRGGKTIAQGFKTSALFPFYLQLGVNVKF